MNTKLQLYLTKKDVLCILLGTAFLLLIPLIAMQFTHEVNWTLFDFIFMGALLLGASFTYKILTNRGAKKSSYKNGVKIALLAVFLLIWVNGAVGIIGNESNPANLMYFGVLLVGILGSFIARLKAKGMALTMFIMAATQLMVPILALIMQNPSTSWGAAGITGVFFLNTVFVILFASSALLFKQAESAQ